MKNYLTILLASLTTLLITNTAHSQTLQWVDNDALHQNSKELNPIWQDCNFPCVAGATGDAFADHMANGDFAGATPGVTSENYNQQAALIWNGYDAVRLGEATVDAQTIIAKYRASKWEYPPCSDVGHYAIFGWDKVNQKYGFYLSPSGFNTLCLVYTASNGQKAVLAKKGCVNQIADRTPIPITTSPSTAKQNQTITYNGADTTIHTNGNGDINIHIDNHLDNHPEYTQSAPEGTDYGYYDQNRQQYCSQPVIYDQPQQYQGYCMPQYGSPLCGLLAQACIQFSFIFTNSYGQQQCGYYNTPQVQNVVNNYYNTTNNVNSFNTNSFNNFVVTYLPSVNPQSGGPAPAPGHGDITYNGNGTGVLGNGDQGPAGTGGHRMAGSTNMATTNSSIYAKTPPGNTIPVATTAVKGGAQTQTKYSSQSMASTNANSVYTKVPPTNPTSSNTMGIKGVAGTQTQNGISASHTTQLATTTKASAATTSTPQPHISYQQTTSSKGTNPSWSTATASTQNVAPKQTWSQAPSQKTGNITYWNTSNTANTSYPMQSHLGTYNTNNSILSNVGTKMQTGGIKGGMSVSHK